MYKDKLPSAGLYWAQLADRGRVLKALNTPKLGDSLLKDDGSPWMGDLAREAPKLNWDDLTQVAALPLGSWLKTDPWDDKVHMLNAKRYAPMNARDKMPLEVTPIVYKLQRYDASKLTAMPAPASPQPSAQPASAPPPADPSSANPTPPGGGEQTAAPGTTSTVPSNESQQLTGTSQPPQ
jgi:hypothetical protein